MSLVFLLLLCDFVQNGYTWPGSETKVPIAQFNDWDALYGGKVKAVVQLIQAQEKNYYLGIHFKATYFQAAQLCEDIHMDLVTIESSEENDLLYKYIRDANKGDLFWTSATKLLDGKHWVWMSTGTFVDYTNWAPGNPDSQVEHCLAAFHSKDVGLTWTDKDCLMSINFICERRLAFKNGNTSVTSVPKQWSGVYENSYMSANVPLFHTKDKSYFLGRYFHATFQEAFQICGMMNMHLVAISTKEENDRIYKYIRDTNAGDAFWTSGSRIIDGITWVWMSTAQIVNYTNWSKGQPDSVIDNCIQLVSQKDTGVFWVDSSCLKRFSYICEKPKDAILFDRRPPSGKKP